MAYLTIPDLKIFNFCILGRGHTNYDIQIIVVILKVTTRIFQQRPWIIGKIIMIVLGSHMPNMNYEVTVVPLRWS